MIPEFRRILYTTDLSDNARRAFAHAASLANRYDGKITILHAIEQLSQNTRMLLSSMLGDNRWEEVQTEGRRQAEALIRERLQQFCSDMEAQLNRCPFLVEQILIRDGQAVEEITAEVATGSYDVVVMGSHGQGGVSDAVMGSTARRVVRRAKVPVLVVHI